MNASDPTSTRLAALRGSSRHLAGLIAPLTDEQIASPAYPTEWSVAQVISHLGSGAEIFSLFLNAGRTGAPAPGGEQIQPIWDAWNAKGPSDQAHDGVQADAAFVAELDDLDDAARESWQLEMFGAERGLADLLAFRLGEHALHTWDVAVALDPAAAVLPDSTAAMVDNLDLIVGRTGKAPAQPIAVHVTTAAPERTFRLQAGGEIVQLEPHTDSPASESDATLQLPAEALIRLVYGRLDPDHTPPLEAAGVELESLRQIFPGP